MRLLEPLRGWIREDFASAVNLRALSISMGISFVLLALAGDAARLGEFALAIGALTLLLVYPEFALALYVVIGDLKGDDRVASVMPIDLTLGLGAILLAGALLNLLRGKPIVRLPWVYVLFLPLVFLMTVSLLYTPVFAWGLEKLGRFLTVTSIAIMAPFFVLTDPAAMKRFFWCFGVVAYAICVFSLAGLGGAERLVSPSDNTIGLGRVACILAAVIWFAAVPRWRLAGRMLACGVLSVPLIAMVGSGSRGAAVALALAILLSVVLCRRLLVDVAAFVALALVILPFTRVPQSSLEYLGTLGGTTNMDGLLDFRMDLLDHGWKLLQHHPLFGAGLGGFRYSSPNPGLYKWPHNIFLELACELGIPAAIIACAIFGAAVRESYRQLSDHVSSLFRISTITSALLLIGIVTVVNTGDINSDRSAWLFVSLVFVIRGYRLRNSRPSPAGTFAAMQV